MNLPRSARISLAPVLMSSLLVALPAAAQLSISGEATAYAYHSRDFGYQDSSDGDQIAVWGPNAFPRFGVRADSDGQDQLYNANARSWAELSAGGIHLFARSQSVSSMIEQRYTNSYGFAYGLITDNFGLTVPNVAPGAVFTATVNVRVDGNAWAISTPSSRAQGSQSEAAGFSYWASWVQVKQGSSGPTLAETRSREDCDFRSSASPAGGCKSEGGIGLKTLTFQLVNGGAPVQLLMGAWVRAGTSVYQMEEGSFNADSQSDMGHTLAWAGITELRDANGVLVSDFSAFSVGSGFDYRNAYVAAVPEHGTLALFAAGLALLGLQRRRRA